MIRTTVERTKRTGYWCAAGDKLGEDICKGLGKEPGEWLSILGVLEHGGLSLALQGLVGSPDAAAATVAQRFAEWLHQQATEQWNLRMADAQPTMPRALGAHNQTSSKQAKLWWELAKQATLPSNRLLARTNFLLFTGKYPLAINCVHALKCYLTAAKTGSLYAETNSALATAVHVFKTEVRHAETHA